MINPVNGFASSEAELRMELTHIRAMLETYHTLDRQTGGAVSLAKNIILLEKALGGADMTLETAEYDFLRRNATVNWNSGIPTWDHWDLVDGEWVVTTYEIEATLTNPRIKTEGNL